MNKKNKKSVVLIILSGWGIEHDYDGNIIAKADTLNFDKLISKFPATTLFVKEKDASSKNSYFLMGTGRRFGKDKRKISNSLSEIISKEGIKQLKITEIEKYGYTSYFFNGCNNDKFEGEELLLLENKKVNDYSKDPEFMLSQITKETIMAIESEKYNFILTSLPNIDLTARTGDLKALKIAVEAVDESLTKILRRVLDNSWIAIVTADHGNAEKMVNMQSETVEIGPKAGHVPLLIVDKDLEGKRLNWQDSINGDLSLAKPQGDLSNIAPTILKILGLKELEEIKSDSLI